MYSVPSSEFISLTLDFITIQGLHTFSDKKWFPDY